MSNINPSSLIHLDKTNNNPLYLICWYIFSSCSAYCYRKCEENAYNMKKSANSRSRWEFLKWLEFYIIQDYFELIRYLYATIATLLTNGCVKYVGIEFTWRMIGICLILSFLRHHSFLLLSSLLYSCTSSFFLTSSLILASYFSFFSYFLLIS